MQKNREYEVIQTLEQGQQCHIVFNRIKGRTIEEICASEDFISREDILSWMRQIIEHLDHLHRCNPQTTYRFLTPYTVIIDRGNKLYFVDPEQESNRDLMRKVYEPKVQEAFFGNYPGAEKCSGISLDIYSAGKVMQYILAKCRVSPEFGRIEELSYRHLITKATAADPQKRLRDAEEFKVGLSKCSKYYQDRRDKKRTGKRQMKYAAAIGIIVLVAVIGQFGFNRFSNAQAKERTVSEEKKKSKKKPKEDAAAGEVVFEMGKLYFRDLKDYPNSISCFQKAKGVAGAGEYQVLAEYMGGFSDTDEQTVFQALETLADYSKSKETYEKAKMQADFAKCYFQLKQGDQASNYITESLESRQEWKNDDIGGVLEKELLGMAVTVLTEKEDWKGAVERQKEYLNLSEECGEDPEMLEVMSSLYRRGGFFSEGEAFCSEKLESLSNKKNLLMDDFYMICSNTETDSAEKERRLTDAKNKMPEIVYSNEFKKLMQDHKLTVKEGKVCFEKP